MIKRLMAIMLIIMLVVFFIDPGSLLGKKVDRKSIPLLKWMGPEGSRPGTYEEYIARFPITHFTIQHIVSKNTGAIPATGKVLVIVNTAVYSNLTSRINRYVSSLDVHGYSVELHTSSGGSAEDLKAFIQARETNLIGCVFIGSLPVAWYEVADDFYEYGYASFPCDLFFMDLDGTWQDGNTNGLYDAHIDGSGDQSPEIFIGRIDASMMSGNEYDLLSDYFDKNNDYWQGNITLLKYGLTYTEDDWASHPDFLHDMSYLYGARYQAIAAPSTNRNDYLNNRIKNSAYEFIQLSCHSYSGGHHFTRGGYLYSADVRSAPPQAMGYNLFCCSACRYTYSNYLGGAYIFNLCQKALSVIGSSKTGSMLDFDAFYVPLGSNKPIGVAFKEWFEAIYPYSEWDVFWHYGMTICGDPLISFLSTPVQVDEGRYVVAGRTDSFTHGTGDEDMLVYMLDANGNKVWRKNFGGTNVDMAFSIRQTADDGFVVAGLSHSFTHGSADFLLYKLDANGNKMWRKNFGGVYSDSATTAIQTTDGGYAIFGQTYTFTHGDYDFLIYKLDSNGSKQWRHNFGSTGIEYAWDWFPTGSTLTQTNDGGYMICGISDTFTHGDWDFLLYKLNGNGFKQWRKNLGGSDSDQAYAIQQTSDSGYVVAGNTESFTHGTGDFDFLIYKLDASGNKQWRKNLGGLYDENGMSIYQTTDGGYVVAGWTETFVHGTVGSDSDFLIYKLDASGNKQWRRNFGGTELDRGTHIIQTSDGGYIVAGYTESFTQGTGDRDFLIYKLDANGNKQWRKNMGGIGRDEAFCIREISH